MASGPSIEGWQESPFSNNQIDSSFPSSNIYNSQPFKNALFSFWKLQSIILLVNLEEIAAINRDRTKGSTWRKFWCSQERTCFAQEPEENASLENFIIVVLQILFCNVSTCGNLLSCPLVFYGFREILVIPLDFFPIWIPIFTSPKVIYIKVWTSRFNPGRRKFGISKSKFHFDISNVDAKIDVRSLAG